MFHRRNMPIYLVLGWAVIDLLLLGGQLFFGFGTNLYLVRLLVLCGQFAAVTGWITLGNEGIKTNLAGIVSWPILNGLMELPRRGIEGTVAMLAMSVAIVAIYGAFLNLPLIIARTTGWRFSFDPEPKPGDVPIYQFSIREIMFLMVLVALVAGLWTATRPSAPARAPTSSTAVLAIFIDAALLAFPIPWSIWAAFALARPFYGGLVALLASCLWGVVFVRLSGVVAPSLLLGLIPPAVMIVHLLALQAAGFRLQTREPQQPVLVDNGPDWKHAELWKRFGRPGSQD